MHIKWIWCICLLIFLIILNAYCGLFPMNIEANRLQSQISIFSYNVHSQSDDFEHYALDISNMITCLETDFVFLTEYYESTNDTLQSVLEKHYPYVNKKHRWNNNDGDVFYSRWPIDSVRSYIIGSHFCSIYRVQIHKGSDTLAIYCCHLSSNNLKLNEGRLASLKEGRRLRFVEADTIVNASRSEKYPVVVIGDMNDVPFSPTIKRIKSTGLKDAWWNGGFGYGSTYHNDWLRLRIDYAFYDDKHLNLQNIDVIGEETWSDHRALVVGFNFK